MVKLTKKIYNKCLKAHRLAVKHRELQTEIYEDLQELGLDVEKMCYDDFHLLTEMCQMGTGFVTFEEANQEIKEHRIWLED